MSDLLNPPRIKVKVKYIAPETEIIQSVSGTLEAKGIADKSPNIFKPTPSMIAIRIADKSIGISLMSNCRSGKRYPKAQP